MMNETSYSHTGKTVRRYPVMTACALLAATLATASCSVVEDTGLFRAAAADTTTLKAKVEPAKKSYGYEKPDKSNIVLVADAAAARDISRPVYSGSSPYICSPSGFGQKSRCFLRP